jgi:hypothetical protein
MTKKIDKKTNGFYCNVKQENIVLPITASQAVTVVLALLTNYIGKADLHMSRMLVRQWHIQKNYTMQQAMLDCTSMIKSIKKNALWYD